SHLIFRRRHLSQALGTDFRRGCQSATEVGEKLLGPSPAGNEACSFSSMSAVFERALLTEWTHGFVVDLGFRAGSRGIRCICVLGTLPMCTSRKMSRMSSAEDEICVCFTGPRILALFAERVFVTKVQALGRGLDEPRHTTQTLSSSRRA
ncbi:hypothetical protein P154DRAFT_589057, partial [Amniculicola lignicola CBS 123094]